jgi:hypothetical protein
LNDRAELERLLALLDGYRPGELPPVLHAERDLTRARFAARNGGDVTGELLAAAVSTMRARSTPYHYAHGLLDHAEHLASVGRPEEITAQVNEARAIAERLRCGPLVLRSDALSGKGRPLLIM